MLTLEALAAMIESLRAEIDAKMQAQQIAAIIQRQQDADERDMDLEQVRILPYEGSTLRNSFQGYQADTQQASLNMTIVPGSVYIAGVKVTPSPAVPTTQALTDSTPRYNYLTIDVGASTAAYTGDAAADPGNGTDTLEYVVLHEVTIAASVITEIDTRQCGDIHIERTSE